MESEGLKNDFQMKKKFLTLHLPIENRRMKSLVAKTREEENESERK